MQNTSLALKTKLPLSQESAREETHGTKHLQLYTGTEQLESRSLNVRLYSCYGLHSPTQTHTHCNKQLEQCYLSFTPMHLITLMHLIKAPVNTTNHSEALLYATHTCQITVSQYTSCTAQGKHAYPYIRRCVN